VKVTAVETLRLAAHPELLWVRVEGDSGEIGLGETMPRVGPVERVIHEVLAPLLLGTELAPAAFWDRAFRAVAYHGFAGAELRALSALDIAQWDLLGQSSGLPVHRLLGGPCREEVPVYNTCVSRGSYPDHERYVSEPGELARELADEGFAAMKIWPFDELSRQTLGHRVDRGDLLRTCRIFGQIREAVGDRIEVAVEGHSCWGLPAATAIAHAVEEFRPMWLEDMLPVGDPAAWARLKESTGIPICGSERAFTRYGIAPYLPAVDVVNQDLGWTGGFTEFTRVAALASARELPVAPHNCHGPVAAMATVHASAAVPNLYLMESVRAFERGFFADLVDAHPVVEGGRIRVPERPGLGLSLRPEVLARASRVRSDAGSAGGAAAAAEGWSDGDPWSGALGERI
jgi:galactonate dehydratase